MSSSQKTPTTKKPVWVLTERERFDHPKYGICSKGSSKNTLIFQMRDDALSHGNTFAAKKEETSVKLARKIERYHWAYRELAIRMEISEYNSVQTNRVKGAAKVGHTREIDTDNSS